MTRVPSASHSRCVNSASADGPLEFRDARRTVVLVASGASAGQADLALARDWPVVVVNDAWRLAPWAAALYAADRGWWLRHYSEVATTFHGERWTQDKTAAAELCLQRIEGQHRSGLCTTPGRIYFNSNSGAQAMNLAYHWGARRFVLVGYDMGGPHFFGDHPPELLQTSDRMYGGFIKAFGVIAEDCRRLGLEVVNTSPISRLRCFQSASLSSVLGG